MATSDTTIDSITEWRVARLEELGFTKDQATLLEQARKTVVVKGGANKLDKRYERVLDWHTVKRCLDNGATHELIMRIYI